MFHSRPSGSAGEFVGFSETKRALRGRIPVLAGHSAVPEDKVGGPHRDLCEPAPLQIYNEDVLPRKLTAAAEERDGVFFTEVVQGQ